MIRQGESVFVMNKQSNRVTKFTANNFWSGRWQDGDLSDLSLQDAIGADSGPDALWGEKDRKTMKKGPLQKSSVVVCSITTIDDLIRTKLIKPGGGFVIPIYKDIMSPWNFIHQLILMALLSIRKILAAHYTGIRM